MVDIWKYSELFASRRANLETSDRLIARLLRCSWCLSPWAVAVITVLLFIGSWLSAGPWVIRPLGYLALLPGYALAGSKVANLLHDYFHETSRIPRSYQLPTQTEETD